MNRYIKKFESPLNELKKEALEQLLGININQISKTDDDTYDTFSKYGEETFKVYSKDEIINMDYNDFINKIDKYLSHHKNPLFYFNLALTRNINIKPLFNDYNKFCNDEYKIYSDKLNDSDNILKIITSGGSTIELNDYVETIKKGDYNFIIKHILFLLKNEYTDLNERVKFINDIIDLDKLKKYIINKLDLYILAIHIASDFSNSYIVKLSDNLYYKFLIIQVE